MIVYSDPILRWVQCRGRPSLARYPLEMNVALAAALITSSCTMGDVIPKGDRVLSMAVGPGSDGDYGRAFALAKGAGVQSVSLHLAWDDIEKGPGQFDGKFLEIANAFYPPQGVSVPLDLAVLDTNRDRRPADLRNKAFNDPAVVARFSKLLDFVFSKIPDLKLDWLAIGNEVDATLGTDSTKWKAYSLFFAEAKRLAKARRPGLKVGVKTTFGASFGSSANLVADLNAHADLVLVTYYPLQGDFTVEDPKVVHADLERLCAGNPGRRIDLAETGFPSGAKTLSSPQKQAQFFRELFQAWDKHAKQVRMVLVNWQTDISPASVATFKAYYGLDTPAFLEFLGTLGLREWSGIEKPAWGVFRAEAKARGW